MEIALALLIGVGIGIALTYFFTHQSKRDAESIAASISASVMASQTEQILQLAETKLAGKKEVIDGTLQSMKESMKRDMDRVELLMKSIGDKNVSIDSRLENAAKVIKELGDTTGDLKNAPSANPTDH